MVLFLTLDFPFDSVSLRIIRGGWSQVLLLVAAASLMIVRTISECRGSSLKWASNLLIVQVVECLATNSVL